MTDARVAIAALLCLACAGNDPSAPGSGPAISVADFGARGDGQTFDDSAIQAAVDAVPAKGTVRFPPGTYRIPGDKGIRLKDDMRLDLGDAVLVATNVDGAKCRLLWVDGGRNIVISGGTLVGSRGGKPTFSMGILAGDVEDLVIENVKLRDFYFDGILLTGDRGCRRVSIRNVVSENNRRTGLAIVYAYDVTVEGSTFRGTKGQSPAAGVNCEPNAGQEVRNVSFRGCTFAGNATGLYAHRGRGKLVENVSVADSVVSDNGQGIAIVSVEGTSIVNNRVTGHRDKGKSGIVVGDASGARIAGNQLEDNFRGIFSAGAARTDIRGNTVVGTGPGSVPGGSDDASGIVCLGLPGWKDDACDVAQNRVRRTAGSGIVAQLVSRVHLLDNVVEETGRRGILLLSTTASEVKGNDVSQSGLETPGRYDAIELAQAADANVISGNTVRLSPSVRQAIGIGPGCQGNQVVGNVVLPD